MASPDGGAREVPLPHQSKVGWIWGFARNDVVIPQPFMGFYWNMPQDAPCILSLPKAQRCFRRGEVSYGRRSAAWNDDDVRNMVAALRLQRGPKMNTLVRPRTWEDMYQYFDAVDLWTMGAWNLWRVVHLACDENEEGAGEPDPSRSAALAAVDDWAYNWCTHEEHRSRLRAWDERSDILCVLSPAEVNDVLCCGIPELSVLRDVLVYWSRFYKTQFGQEYGGQDVSAASSASNNSLEDARDSLPARALDDNDITHGRPEQSSIPPTSRPRRRSSSLSLPRTSSRRDAGDYCYVANPAVVIMNGTTASRTYQLSSARRLAEARAGGSQGRGHKHSKSGPAPTVDPAHPLATRGAGVDGPGPSRLPSGSHNLSSRATGASRQPVQPVQPTQPTQPTTAGPVEAGISNNRTSHDQRRRSQGSGHRANCPNHSRRSQGPDLRFAPCSCQLCAEKARSVHIAPLDIGGMSSREARAAIADHLRQWGHVEDCELKKSCRGNHYALVRFASEASAHLAVRRSREEGGGHPRLGCFAISYPMRSKHFRPEPRPRLGSDGSHLSAGNRSSSSGGTGNLSSSWDGGSPPYGSGSRRAQQSQQRLGGSLRSKPPYQWAERASLSAIRTPPDRSLSQPFPDPPHPALSAHPRSHSMTQPGQHQYQQQSQHPNWISSPAGAFSGSPAYESRTWSGHYCPRGPPPFNPHLPPPPFPGHYVSPSYQPFFGNPYAHHAWPDMPVPPPAASSYCPPMPLPPPPPPPPLPLPLSHAQHYPGFEGPRYPGFHCAARPPQPPPPEPAYGWGTRPPAHLSPPIFSAQTKPPSEAETFGSCPGSSSDASTRSAQSFTASASVRVRLPGLPREEPFPDTASLLPGHNGDDEESPARGVTSGEVSSETSAEGPAPVSVLGHFRTRLSSSVRRITFGDFGPPQTPGPTTASPAVAGGCSESTTPTPTPMPMPTPAAAPATPLMEPLAGGATARSGTRALTPDDDTGRTRQPAPSTPTQKQRINGHRETHASQEYSTADAESDDTNGRAFERQLDQLSTLLSRQNVGDVRLDPEYTATVIRRRPRHGRVYSSWMADGMAPAAQQTYPEDAAAQPQGGGAGVAAWAQAQSEISPSRAWNPAAAPFAPPPPPRQHYQHYGPGEPYTMTKHKGKKRRAKRWNKARLGPHAATRSGTPVPEPANHNAAFAHQDAAAQFLLPRQSGDGHQPVESLPQQQQTPGGGGGGIVNHVEDADVVDGVEARNGSRERDRKGKGKGKAKAAATPPLERTEDYYDNDGTGSGEADSSNGGGGGKSWHGARKRPASDQKKAAQASAGAAGHGGSAREAAAYHAGEADAAGRRQADTAEDSTTNITNMTNYTYNSYNHNSNHNDAGTTTTTTTARPRPSAYRAHAGGSLRIPRQRQQRAQAGARGDVRDLFGDPLGRPAGTHRDWDGDRARPEQRGV
ncbi:hypothetical protein VTH06DRAFT_4449 [Thermothelomyces fergusii]